MQPRKCSKTPVPFSHAFFPVHEEPPPPWVSSTSSYSSSLLLPNPFQSPPTLLLLPLRVLLLLDTRVQLVLTSSASRLLPNPSQSPPTLLLLPSRLRLLLNRRIQLSLPRSAPRPSPRPLRLLCHLRLSAQLLVGVDHIRLLGRHFLALDDSEAGCRWRRGSGGRCGRGCCCGGSAGDARCYGDAVIHCQRIN
jgi:hypothetical protein